MQSYDTTTAKCVVSYFDSLCVGGIHLHKNAVCMAQAANNRCGQETGILILQWGQLSEYSSFDPSGRLSENSWGIQPSLSVPPILWQMFLQLCYCCYKLWLLSRVETLTDRFSPCVLFSFIFNADSEPHLLFVLPLFLRFFLNKTKFIGLEENKQQEPKGRHMGLIETKRTACTHTEESRKKD